MNLGPWTGRFILPKKVTTMLSLSLVGSLNLSTPCRHYYELGCVFLHTLLGMTVFIQQTQFALHIFPSTNLPYKQTRWALPQRMRCTSRLGISPSKGLLNLFHKENSQIKNHINKQSFFDLWTHQPNLHIFVLHPSPYGFFIFALALSG